MESCKRRCFPDGLYAEVGPGPQTAYSEGPLISQVGAEIVDELSGQSDVVLGIKEAPVKEVEKLKGKDPSRRRTWMMFSHTHKGQVGGPLAAALQVRPGEELTFTGL